MGDGPRGISLKLLSTTPAARIVRQIRRVQERANASLTVSSVPAY
jgi:hypothetical protein